MDLVPPAPDDRGPGHELPEPVNPWDKQVRFRRATDRYIARGYVAVSLFMWIAVVRLTIAGDAVGAIIYAVPAALMTWAAVMMAIQALKHWRS